MKLPNPLEQPTLSIEETAAVLGLGRSAAYESARAGEIPTLKFGRRIRVPTAALRRMLAIDPEPQREDAAPSEEGRHLSVVNDPRPGDHGRGTG